MLLRLTLLVVLVAGEVHRLPKNVAPKRYHLALNPDLLTLTYNGSVTIEIEALEDTASVTLHSNVTIEATKIISLHGEEKISSVDSENNETFIIHLQGKLHKGERYNLTLDFRNKLSKGLSGFFYSRYYDKKFRYGSEDSSKNFVRVLVATQFEPSAARTAFPCFDEPGLKASFIVSLVREKSYNSVSNEEIAFTEDLGRGRFKDTFKETPVMSTYTLAFCISQYKSTKRVGKVRILGTEDDIRDYRWKSSLDAAVTTLEVLENYLGVNYTLNKIDNFPVFDEDFEDAAMENWGLIIYGSTYLIPRPFETVDMIIFRKYAVVHEVAHQWFGNLVTHEWWDCLWLSEGFASYFQYHVLDYINPSWRPKDIFVVEAVQGALLDEPIEGAHSLNYKIQYSGEFPPYYLLYLKGAAIIRMMKYFLTEEVFREGLKLYLLKNAFGSVTPAHLYAALQEVVNKRKIDLGKHTVREIMETWDSQKGFPIVTITRDYEHGSVTFQQKSMLDNDTSSKWIIPINYVSSPNSPLEFAKTTPSVWLDKGSLTRDFRKDGWMIVNTQQIGFYHVNYDLENWERIVRFMKSENYSSVHVLNRAQLVSDAFVLAHRKEIPWSIPLRLGEYLVRETDVIPFLSFYAVIRKFVYVPSSQLVRSLYAERLKIWRNYALFNDVVTVGGDEFYVYKKYFTTILKHVNATLGKGSKPGEEILVTLHRTEFRALFSGLF